MKQLHKGTTIQFAAAVKDKVLVLDINDFIGMTIFADGITAQSVTDALKAEHDRVIININSPGGDPFAGTAIYNLLKANAKPVTVNITGLAASAATIVACVGDTVVMGEGTRYMIHNAKAGLIGNAKELRQKADLVEGISNDMAAIYAARSKQDQTQVQAWMDAETWFSAQEAVDNGFADKLSGQKANVKAAANVDLSLYYRNVPEELKVKAEAPAPVVEKPLR
jgi:ATP-dependent Clp protease, protease subunit